MMQSAIAKTRQDRLLSAAVLVGGLIFGLMILFYIHPVYHQLGSHAVTIYDDVLAIVLSLLITILSFLLAREAGWRETLGRIWLYLAVGIGLWFLGEVIWGYFEVILDKETPYPSTADIAWVLGYIPLTLAFISRLRSLHTLPDRRLLLTATGIFALMALVVVIFVAWPIATSKDYNSRFEQFIDILYPLGDLALAYVALLVMAVLAGGALSRVWLLIAAGFLLMSVSDLTFVYATWHDLYVGKTSTEPNLITTFTDLSYVLAYIVIAFGVMVQARLQRII